MFVGYFFLSYDLPKTWGHVRVIIDGPIATNSFLPNVNEHDLVDT
jgi:hypothetical protein